MKYAQTWTASIKMGLKNLKSGAQHSLEELLDYLQARVDERGLCVEVTPCWFVYTGGREQGACVGLINYPRFPKEPYELRFIAIELAELLKKTFGQERCSIVFQTDTVMLGE